MPPYLSRRSFVAGLAATGAAAGLATRAITGRSPAHAEGTSPSSGAAGLASTPAGGPLVLVNMIGGNDGLNTVIPYTDPLYLAGRATLGYQPNEVIPLADGLGLNPSLVNFKKLWDAKHLAVVRGVGYPDPVLSHFRSQAIWQSASPTTAESTGWVGRWLDQTGTDPLRAVTVGPTLPLLAAGANQAAASVTYPPRAITLPASTRSAFTAMATAAAKGAGPLARVGQTGADMLQVNTEVTKAASTVASTIAAGAPGNALAGQLDLVSRLIRAGLPTRVYVVTLGSFDTHVNEKATQARLLGDLDTAVSAFLAEVGSDPHGTGTVVATFSEFGRRVAANASGGTDHGTAAPLFVAGAPVKGGFYGEEPSLSALEAGNLEFTTDFRSVYATLLGPLLGYDPTVALQGRFPTIGFL